MPPRLEARLFGEVSFRFGDQVVLPRSRKLTALMALLALRQSGVRRDELAELIWPPGRLANLRQALYELRRLPGAETWLQVGNDVVRLDAHSDVAAFELALEQGNTAAAVALSAGDLLGDQPELDAPGYQEWVADTRRRLVDLRVSALGRESVRLETAGDLGAARAMLRGALELDPLHEPLYRSAMRVAYALGDASDARAIFVTCLRVLGRELGAEPSHETRLLADLIARGQPLAMHVDVGSLHKERLRLLQALVVADGALNVTAVAAVLERPEFEVAEELAALERGAVVSTLLEVAPHHHAAVSAAMPAAVRRLLHERVAGRLGADPTTPPATVARHLLAANDARAAAPLLLAAAQEAFADGRLEPAVDLLFRAGWAASEQPELRLTACLLLEGAAAQRGDKELQDAALAEAERLAWESQADQQLAEVRMRRSRLQLARGNVGHGLELALEALGIALRLQDEPLIARARNAVGGARYFAGDLAGAEEVFGANLETGDRVERYRAHSNLGSLAAMRGALDEAYPHFEAALTLARAGGPRADIAATLNNLAATAERVGQYAKAVRHFKEGIEISLRNRSPGHEGRMLVNLAVVYARQGQLGPAWNTAAEVEELAATLADPRLTLSAVELKADVLRACGMLNDAAEGMRAAFDAATAMHDERKVLTLAAQLKTIEAVRADEPAAAVDAITAVDSARLTDVAPWLWLELSLAARDAESALRYRDRAGGESALVHQRVVADIATVRAALLVAADDACVEAATLAAGRLLGAGGTVGALERLELVERPLGDLLIAALAHATEEGLAPSTVAVPLHVTAELDEQARGLPRAMAESLRLQPDRWLASLLPR